jgi:hypothetical protein
MGGGSARSALALASRTLRTRCVTYLPATSASLQLLEAKSLTGRPENGSISGGDQHIFSKDSWQTMLTFAAAGLMAFTGSSFSVAAGATVLTEVLVFLDHALCLCDQQSLMILCIIAR